ncbi:unnamed protein product [Strongylus vulgaris]|uniref:Uncharacterized protein n=1 Tax=Strongylus vulgaris TaxID=40348 RepID=A0A3P7LNI8_STRVU|nr:unnamed protein product [Strongylus vulgaris]
MPTVASVLAEQKAASKQKPTHENGGNSPTKTTKVNNSQKSQQPIQKPNGEAKAIQKVDTSTPRPTTKVEFPTSPPSRSKDLPQKSADVLPKNQPLPSVVGSSNKKQPRPNVQENGTFGSGKMAQGNNSVPKPKPIVSASPSASENPRPVQPVLPQVLNPVAEVRTVPTASPATETTPKSSNSIPNGEATLTASSSNSAVKESTAAVSEPVVKVKFQLFLLFFLTF